MTEPGTTAQDTLRGDILATGRDDFVSMAAVQGRISRGRWPTRRWSDSD
jgi:hypothetical protein